MERINLVPDGPNLSFLTFQAHSIEDILTSRDKIVNEILQIYKDHSLTTSESPLARFDELSEDLLVKLFGDAWILNRVITSRQNQILRYQLYDNIIFLPFVRHNPETSRKNDTLTLSDPTGTLETTFSFSISQKSARKELRENYWASPAHLIAFYRSDFKDRYFFLGPQGPYLQRQTQPWEELINLFPKLRYS